jgi:hypothetical protein
MYGVSRLSVGRIVQEEKKRRCDEDNAGLDIVQDKLLFTKFTFYNVVQYSSNFLHIVSLTQRENLHKERRRAYCLTECRIVDDTCSATCPLSFRSDCLTKN